MRAETWGGHYLHAAIVYDHCLKLDFGVQFSNFLTALQEQPIPEFHDVGLVDSRDLAPPLLGGIVKGKLCNPLRFGSSDNLQALNHTPCTLMFQ